MKKKKIIIGSVIVVSICLLIGTFAWLTWRSRETGLVLTVGDINNLQVTLKPYQVDTEIIPVLTYENEEYVTVSAVNNTSRNKKVKLYYKIDKIDTELIDENFKYTITKSVDSNTYEEYLTGNFSEASGNSNLYIMEENIPKNTTYNYRVYLWLDGSSSGQGNISGKIFKGELRVEFDSIDDIIVDTPDGLIPIIYDTSDNNTLVKTINKNDDNWYDYEDKKWANAVLVKTNGTNTREYYQNNIGVTIPEEDILAYYVYVPRYKYKIWEKELSSAGKEQEIDIVFENKNMPKSNGSKVGEYITHPAFTFGSDELNGIWVGKFETTGTGDNPTIKPNQVALTNQNVASQFTTSKKINNTYGIGIKSDSHMAKNSEWEAAAYLSHSKYGANREIYFNNSKSYYTGRSGGNVGGSTPINITYPDQTSTVQHNTYGFYTWDGFLLEYDTNNQTTTSDLTKVASTTGNIYGIYDMSGGAFEYVMGIYSADGINPRAGYSTESNSGFNGILADESMYTSGIDFPDSKYYDLYTTTEVLTSCNGNVCFGHGLSEVENWYSDTHTFITKNVPYLIRGGQSLFIDSNKIYAGLFAYHRDYGNALDRNGFRTVLVKN